MKRVVSLYADRSPLYEELNERAKDYARDLGLEYVWISHEGYSPEAAVEALREADAGIIDVDPFNGEMFSRISDRCRLLVRYGVGFDAVDLEGATRAGVAVARTSGANAQSVAEMALAMILAAKRLLVRARKVVESGVWSHSIGSELRGGRLGILGFGAIGRSLAEITRGFELDLYVYDPFLPAGVAERYGAHQEDLDTIFRECDAISVHVPYTKQTHHLVNAERLALMKRDAVIVCNSRGNVVDEEALADALRKGRILGAGLDVFAVEPLPADSPLLSLDNVLLAPHDSSQTTEALWNIYKCALDVTSDFFAGRELGKEFLLNPEYAARARRKGGA